MGGVDVLTMHGAEKNKKANRLATTRREAIAAMASGVKSERPMYVAAPHPLTLPLLQERERQKLDFFLWQGRLPRTRGYGEARCNLRREKQSSSNLT